MSSLGSVGDGDTGAPLGSSDETGHGPPAAGAAAAAVSATDYDTSASPSAPASEGVLAGGSGGGDGSDGSDSSTVRVPFEVDASALLSSLNDEPSVANDPGIL